MFYMRRPLVHLIMIFYIIFEKETAHKKTDHPTENLNGFSSFMTHFQKNGERIPIFKIRFRFSGVHRFNISRI